MNNNVAVGLLVFPVFVFVALVGCRPVGADACNAN
jgi:hypothetical protein